MSRIQGKIDNVKGVMMDNIDKVLERGERLDLLLDRTEELSDSSLNFKRGGQKLKRAVVWRNVLIGIVLCVIVAVRTSLVSNFVLDCHFWNHLGFVWCALL